MKICNICFQGKDFSEFSECGRYKDRIYYRRECKECNRNHQREFGKEAQVKYRNSEHGRQKKKEYKQTPKYREQQRKYENNRLKTDPLFKLKHYLRIRIKIALRCKKWTKSCKFNHYIGCSLPELKSHLEKQFQPGMSWSNHGDWHIDHIIPLNSAETPEAMYKLCHYTNLQPLWAFDNMKKGSKVQ